MPHKTTITGNTHASTMVTLHENIKQKCRGKLSAGVLLLHDNASTYQSCTSQAVMRKCGFVEFNYPPYSPDLAPGDYFLFRNLKKFLHEWQFPNHDAVKKAVTGCFDTENAQFFLRVFDHCSGLMPGFSNVRYRFYSDIDRLTAVLALHERKIAHPFDKCLLT